MKRMNITQAMHKSAKGDVIVSCDGVGYRPHLLQAKKLGNSSAVFNSGVITEKESKGRWSVDE